MTFEKAASDFNAALRQVAALHVGGVCPPKCVVLAKVLQSNDDYIHMTALCGARLLTTMDTGMLLGHLVNTYHAGLIAGRAQVMAELMEATNVEESK